jgi:hypothetical protein
MDMMGMCQTWQEAMKNGLKKFTFEGKEIVLDARTGIFITMNPGYAGRTELPDNLKALFRPVTMIVPDLQQICEIMLFSEGLIITHFIHSLLPKPYCWVVMHAHIYIYIYIYSCSSRGVYKWIGAGLRQPSY